jgi:hypothetical protein
VCLCLSAKPCLCVLGSLDVWEAVIRLLTKSTGEDGSDDVIDTFTREKALRCVFSVDEVSAVNVCMCMYVGMYV